MEVFITPHSKQTVMCHCGVTGCSDQGDRMLRSVLPTTEQLSCDRTLSSVRSKKLPSRTLLMLTGLWHPASDYFATQCPVSSRNLTSIRSALIGHVRSRFFLSRTLLMLIELWHPTSDHFAAQCLVSSLNLTSVRSALTRRVRS